MCSASKALSILAVCAAAIGAGCRASEAPPPPHAIVLPVQPDWPKPPKHLPDELWVCADPNDLPFSREAEDGFENQIASLVASSMNKRLRYAWQHAAGFEPASALSERECDLVFGVSPETADVATTTPYYRSSFVFVSRAGSRPVRTFDDRRLRALSIAIPLSGDDGESAPARAIAARDLGRQVRGFMARRGADRSTPQIIQAVADGVVDVAAMWGPVAGYFAAGMPALMLTPIASTPRDAWPFEFAVAAAARHDNAPLIERVNRILDERRDDVIDLLHGYHVPLVSEPRRGQPKGTM